MYTLQDNKVRLLSLGDSDASYIVWATVLY